MAHCRSPTKGLKNGHFPSNQIQIVPDSNCCKLFMNNRLPAGPNFSPDTSDFYYIHVANVIYHHKLRGTHGSARPAPEHLRVLVRRPVLVPHRDPAMRVRRRRFLVDTTAAPESAASNCFHIAHTLHGGRKPSDDHHYRQRLYVKFHGMAQATQATRQLLR